MIFDVPHLEEHDVAVLAAVDTIRKDLRFHLRSERRWHGTLRRQAKARAIRGSNSIEGISVTAEEAFAIVGGEDSAVDVDSTWLAVKGYSDAMTYAQILAETSESLNLDESTVRALHFMVQGYALDGRPGRYREGDVFVHDDDGGRTVYTAPEPDIVPGLMTEYLVQLHDMSREGLHPLVQGAMAHLNLVMIHPFKDGNGRMSRILQSLMLYQEQVREAEFVSIEEYLGDHTPSYYRVLARVGGGSWNPQRDAREWVEYVLTAHYRQARKVQQRMYLADRIAERVDDMVASGDAPERAVPALEHALSRWRLTNTIYRSLTGASANTASRDLNALVRAGILERQGEKRGAWYRPVEDQRKAVEVERFFVDAVIDPADNPYRYLRRGQEVPVAGGEG